MSAGENTALLAHLRSGTTTLCRCWKLTRTDGVVLGFTDHDGDLVFDGVRFAADTGLTAEALSQSTGLSVDNTEAAGILSALSVSEADIAAGRFDGAEVETWLVNWAVPAERTLRFRGMVGEIRSGGGAFHAELRGLSEALNRPNGRVFQSLCDAGFGDGRCGIDLSDPAYSVERALVGITQGTVLEVTGLTAYAPGWFDRGRLTVLDGAGTGLSARIKRDQRSPDGSARITLWEDLRAAVVPGNRVRLVAGCDKKLATCRDRFANATNFRGFPHLPGEDWLMAVPARAARRNG
ncbi:MAG: DUF2163 domain-containing protein [Qingshengfaniella sp.]